MDGDKKKPKTWKGMLLRDQEWWRTRNNNERGSKEGKENSGMDDDEEAQRHE